MINSTSEIERQRQALRARFGSRLREIRSARGIWQADLAAAAGMTASAISRIEQGVTEPTFSQAALIMDRLEVWTIDLMLPGPDVPPRRSRNKRKYQDMTAASGSQADYLWSDPLDCLAQIWEGMRAQLLLAKGIDIGDQAARDWIDEIKHQLGMTSTPGESERRLARIFKRVEMLAAA